MNIKLHSRLRTFLLSCCLLLCATAGFATTYTFTGTGNWNQSSRWQDGNIPPQNLGVGDVININGNCTLTDFGNFAPQYINGTLTVGASGSLTIESAQLLLAPGGVANIYGTVVCNVSSGFRYDGTLNVYGTVTANVSSAIFSAGYGESIFNVQDGGAVNINSYFGLWLMGSATVSAGGIINISVNALMQGDGTLVNHGTINNVGTFHLETLNFTNNGSFINNGEVTNWAGSFSNAGTLSGGGSFYNFNFDSPLNITNTGTVSPGNSPGCMLFPNNFTNSGTLNIELSDGTACNDYDHILVGGNTTIGGTINISFPNTKPSSPTFTIITVNNGTLAANSPTINWPAGTSGSYAVVGNAFVVSLGVLPVELERFTGFLTDAKQVQLAWHTASESNNDGFHVQRSTDGESWHDLAFVSGNGTTTEAQSYQYTDPQPLPGTSYYRLRQMDFDGKAEHSPTVSVEMGHLNGLSVSPNPASRHTSISIDADYFGEATLCIYDLTGRKLKWQPLTLEGDPIHQKIDLTELPGSGIYLVVVQAGQQQWQQRVVVGK